MGASAVQAATNGVTDHISVDKTYTLCFWGVSRFLGLVGFLPFGQTLGLRLYTSYLSKLQADGECTAELGSPLTVEFRGAMRLSIAHYTVVVADRTVHVHGLAMPPIDDKPSRFNAGATSVARRATASGTVSVGTMRNCPRRRFSSAADVGATQRYVCSRRQVARNHLMVHCGGSCRLSKGSHLSFRRSSWRGALTGKALTSNA